MREKIKTRIVHLERVMTRMKLAPQGDAYIRGMADGSHDTCQEEIQFLKELLFTPEKKIDTDR